jgi:hypothetical protein
MGMVDIDRASLDQAAHGPRKSGFLSSLGGPQFITAQFFTIFATILGVYLAGYVGFQRTLEYDQLVKARQQANLLTSMQAELKDNTDRLRAFVPLLEKTQQGEGVFGDWPRLHLFIWRASAENPVVFDTPPETLAGMQTFYENIGVMLSDEAVQDSFRSITSSNAYGRTQFTEKFDAQVKFAETMLLPALRNAAAAANDTVRDYSD